MEGSAVFGVESEGDSVDSILVVGAEVRGFIVGSNVGVVDGICVDGAEVVG